MEAAFLEAQKVGSQNYPNRLKSQLEYGTAGFRDKATSLSHVMYRMGLLATLRSKALQGKTIGVMITASHNPEEDNGVKLCDPMGEMLDVEWENFATQVANASDESLLQCLVQICCDNKIDFNESANVYLGRDTRSSSLSLSQAVSDGVKILNGMLKDYGLLTTPQLHFVTCCKNSDGNYGKDSSEGYYKKLSAAFKALNTNEDTKHYVPHIFVDGANGIGAQAMNQFIPYLDDKLKIEIFNGGNTNLNNQCGADYVKIQQTVPVGMEIIPFQRYVSLDGDADRLIYFYVDNNQKFHMLDGDKIAALFAKYLMTLVKESGLDANIRVIQTAYANGSSTYFIEDGLKIPVIFAKTGVKNLHHAAVKYDIGIYFEANGHGTVVFGNEVKSTLKNNIENSCSSDNQKSKCQKLLHVIDLINETVGDAISDLLLVETILRDFDWSICDWYNMYHDLPNRQIKVDVLDRSLFSTINAKPICTSPDGLQDCIDALVVSFEKARAFVRPSGTENIVRVYAEAKSQEHADSLAKEIALRVKEYASK